MRWAKPTLLLFWVAKASLGFPSLCINSFKKLSGHELRYIDPTFLEKHSTNYSNEIRTTPVSDQCNYGSCWAHARLSHIEAEIKKRTGKEIKLSRHFLIIQSLMDRISDSLENPNDAILAGGNAFVADNLIKRFGILPEDPKIWKSKINFERSPHSGRLLYYLNSRAAQFHWDTKDLTPESKQYLDLQDSARKEMLDILKTYTGTLPRNFLYNGKRFTPKQFAKAMAGGYSSNSIWIYPETEELSGNLRKESYTKVATLPSYTKSTREPIDVMERKIVEAIKDGRSVTLSFENNTHFTDRETGIMSIEAFRTPAKFSPPPRIYREAFLPALGHHAVDIIGVDLDSEGKLIKLKVKNSWGADSGDLGYYHMYRDYFEHFLSSIYLSEP